MEIIKKQFTFILPDEPYKNTTNNKIEVNAIYEGPKYLICRVNNSTNIVEGVVRGAIDENDTHSFPEENYRFILIDADKKPFEAAYLTGEYTHDLIEDPSFTNPDGSVWTYHYDDYTGGINQAFFMHTLKHVNGSFSGPEYRTHAITREDLFATSLNQAKNIREALKNKPFPAAERTKLEEYATWLENLEETYKDVDHWKIVFPSDIPRF